MKILLALSLSLATLAGATSLQADTLAQWSFESQHSGTFRAGGVWLTNLAAEVGSGVGAAWCKNASAYAFVPGNGSASSLYSSNTTSLGDFYQFALSTQGHCNISVSYDQTSTLSGPGLFYLQYSTDGVNFLRCSQDYLLSAITWNRSAPNPASFYSFDLSALEALDDRGLVYFRVINDSTTAIDGGPFHNPGTYIDNFTVTAQLVPEPNALALLALGGLALRLKKQRGSQARA